LAITVRFSNGETQADTIHLDVLPDRESPQVKSKLALFDPKGETGKVLNKIGVQYDSIGPEAELAAYDILVVGKAALEPGSAAPDIGRVREGLKVVLFEQNSEALERRFGFRVAEYGLREVFKRVPDHPLLAGVLAAHLSNWRGEATLLPPTLKYEIGARHAPEVKWCGIPVTRLWRAGNRGNVASVLIEKPARGDFMPIVDGGFGLQFSPLMEYREGKGMVVFCQLDVTGRTESDPAAEALVRKILQYAATWKPAPPFGRLVYAGDARGRQHLERAGFTLEAYETGKLSAGDALVVGREGAKQLEPDSKTVARFATEGGKILALALSEDEARVFQPLKFGMRKAEHIGSFFESAGRDSLFCGLSAADVHNRDPRTLSLVSSGATLLGDGVLAQGHDSNIVFCQLAPWDFGSSEQNNLRRTFRRSSFLLTRLLANMGAGASTPLLERFHRPAGKDEVRCLEGFYLDAPQEWDDPYRFFCW
jgi:hypothetical protein